MWISQDRFDSLRNQLRHIEEAVASQGKYYATLEKRVQELEFELCALIGRQPHAHKTTDPRGWPFDNICRYCQEPLMKPTCETAAEYAARSGEKV